MKDLRDVTTGCFLNGLEKLSLEGALAGLTYSVLEAKWLPSGFSCCEGLGIKSEIKAKDPQLKGTSPRKSALKKALPVGVAPSECYSRCELIQRLAQVQEISLRFAVEKATNQGRIPQIPAAMQVECMTKLAEFRNATGYKRGSLLHQSPAHPDVGWWLCFAAAWRFGVRAWPITLKTTDKTADLPLLPPMPWRQRGGKTMIIVTDADRLGNESSRERFSNVVDFAERSMFPLWVVIGEEDLDAVKKDDKPPQASVGRSKSGHMTSSQGAFAKRIANLRKRSMWDLLSERTQDQLASVCVLDAPKKAPALSPPKSNLPNLPSLLENKPKDPRQWS